MCTGGLRSRTRLGGLCPRGATGGAEAFAEAVDHEAHVFLELRDVVKEAHVGLRDRRPRSLLLARLG